MSCYTAVFLGQQVGYMLNVSVFLLAVKYFNFFPCDFVDDFKNGPIIIC